MAAELLLVSKKSSSRDSGEYAVFSAFYRARISRRNSREVAVSNAARAHSTNARTARVRMEGTDVAKGAGTRRG
jgi:hypothetical protein